jgi:glutamyl-tRNA reductase
MSSLHCLVLDYRDASAERRAAAWSIWSRMNGDEPVLPRLQHLSFPCGDDPEEEARNGDARAATADEASDDGTDGIPEIDGSAVRECFRLRTCNRAELYLVLPSGRQPSRELFVPGVRHLEDEEAVRHLLRLLLGLESLAIGEEHIVAQFRECYEGNDKRRCGRMLHRLFQRALHLAGTLRSCWSPGRAPSIPYLMLQRFKEHPRWPRVRALVVGTGAMGEETARLLRACRIEVRLVNRTLRKGEEVAERLGLPLLSWENWREAAKDVDGLFLCTDAPEPLWRGSETETLGAGKRQSPEECRQKEPLSLPWVFDLGGIPQSSPESGAIRITVDDLRECAERLLETHRKGLRRLEQEADITARALWEELSGIYGDTYRRLALARAKQVVRDRVERTAKKTGADPEILEAMAWSVVKGVLHPLLSNRTSHTNRVWRLLAETERRS